MKESCSGIKKVFLFVCILSSSGVTGFAASTGDANGNGTVDIVDALLIAQYYVGLNPGSFDASVSDVNCSGAIDVVDALLIAQYYVGLVATLPGCAQTATPTAVPTVPTQAPASYNAIVAKDGSGNYSTVQAAFDAAPSNGSARWVIYVKNGTYKEMLSLASGKNNITIIGQSNTGTILTYDNYASKINPSTGAEYGTSGSASTFIYGSGFYACNVTFQNSAGTVGQALAINVRGDKAVFKNCRFVGNQDTFYGHNCRQYFYDCYFEGTTDFIFGPSIAFFESCRIYTKGGSAITAASTESYVPYGYVFNRCTVTGTGTSITDLGRPWRPYASVAFMNSSLSSAIKPTGWNDWGDSANQATARFAEYANTGDGSNMSGRPAWIKRLSASEASNYNVSNVLKGTYASPQVIDNWNPQTVIDQTGL